MLSDEDVFAVEDIINTASNLYYQEDVDKRHMVEAIEYLIARLEVFLREARQEENKQLTGETGE